MNIKKTIIAAVGAAAITLGVACGPVHTNDHIETDRCETETNRFFDATVADYWGMKYIADYRNEDLGFRPARIERVSEFIGGNLEDRFNELAACLERER